MAAAEGNAYPRHNSWWLGVGRAVNRNCGRYITLISSNGKPSTEVTQWDWEGELDASEGAGI